MMPKNWQKLRKTFSISNWLKCSLPCQTPNYYSILLAVPVSTQFLAFLPPWFFQNLNSMGLLVWLIRPPSSQKSFQSNILASYENHCFYKRQRNRHLPQSADSEYFSEKGSADNFQIEMEISFDPNTDNSIFRHPFVLNTRCHSI